MAKMTDAWLKKGRVSDGIHSDGDGLFLRVKGNARSFVYVWNVGGRRRELSLGSARLVSLKQARITAAECRDMRGRGLDPVEERNRAREAARIVVAAPVVITFAQCANEFIEANAAVWSKATGDRYRGYLANWCGGLSALAIEGVSKSDVVECLRPVSGTPTGTYLRSFVGRVLDYAMVKGLRPEGLNPASKTFVNVLMPVGRYVGEHHKALEWVDVPSVYQRLGELGTVGDAFRLCILCAMRQSEVRKLTWDCVRIDGGEGSRIVIPADRYKTRREMTIPLSEPARALLLSILSNREPQALVFEGRLSGRPISSHAFQRLLDELGVDCKPHGFRSSMATWAVEAGGFSDDLAQRCLGHIVGNAVSRSYQRSDFFEPKAKLMDAWGQFVTSS